MWRVVASVLLPAMIFAPLLGGTAGGLASTVLTGASIEPDKGSAFRFEVELPDGKAPVVVTKDSAPGGKADPVVEEPPAYLERLLGESAPQAQELWNESRGFLVPALGDRMHAFEATKEAIDFDTALDLLKHSKGEPE